MEWFTEGLHENVAASLRINQMLYESDSSGLQGIKIFDNKHYGRVLTLDGVVQTTERDEAIYHEMLTMVPFMAHGAVRDVLIVGGGDGGMLRDALKHTGLRSATMVEIDRNVVDLCRTYLPRLSQGAFEDARTNLVIRDGRQFVREAAQQGGQYDVIIVDSTDPIGPGEVLFTPEFYGDCRHSLRPGGILVTQSGVPDVQADEYIKCARDFGKAGFCDYSFYLATVPSYYGGPMAFGFATDAPAHRQRDLATLTARFEAAGIDTHYYTPALHQGAFALPRHLQRLFPGQAAAR